MTSAEGVRLAARGADLPAAGPDSAVGPLADRLAGREASTAAGAPALASAVLRATARHWDFTAGVPVPRTSPAPWWSCGTCGGSEWVVRYWQFHERPGAPTIPWRCDVSIKCGSCAVLTVHGIAVPERVWLARPRHTSGLRAAFARGSSFEPKLWATGAGVRRGNG